MTNKSVSPKATTGDASVASSKDQSVSGSESCGKVQGEGDYESARRYDKDVKRYVETADIDQAAHDAAPKNSEEAAEMQAAEQAGRARAKLPKPKK
jgi:hypothetical protein